MEPSSSFSPSDLILAAVLLLVAIPDADASPRPQAESCRRSELAGVASASRADEGPIRRNDGSQEAAQLLPAWAVVVDVLPPDGLVTDSVYVRKVQEAGLPWRIRHEGLGMNFLLVPAGVTVRGAEDDDTEAHGKEIGRHWVRIESAFYLGETEVTEAQWRLVQGLDPVPEPAGRLPRVNVTWRDLLEFCTRSGLELPRDSEWEYAARAGRSARVSLEEIQRTDWVGADGWESGPQAVGTRGRNAWGFADMLGNVREATCTRYGNYRELVPVGAELHPELEVSSLADDRIVSYHIVFRGGSYLAPLDQLQPTMRISMEPDVSNRALGLRAAYHLSNKPDMVKALTWDKADFERYIQDRKPTK